MSAEIPLDADGSHPEQAPESRVRASNVSHTLTLRDNQAEKARQRRGKEETLSDRSNSKCNHQKGDCLRRTDDIEPFRKLLTDCTEEMDKYTKQDHWPVRYNKTSEESSVSALWKGSIRLNIDMTSFNNS